MDGKEALIVVALAALYIVWRVWIFRLRWRDAQRRIARAAAENAE